MKTGITSQSILITIMVLIMGCSTKTAETSPAAPKRIGIYDSRCIVHAYMDSDIYRQTEGMKMKENKAELKRARETGDKKRVKELEKWGRAQQKQLHRQGFGTAPVDHIIDSVSDQLPSFMEQTEIDLLASKWDKKMSGKYKSAEQIDITMQLAELFDPDEKMLKTIEEIQQKKPIPNWLLSLMSH